MCYTFKERSVPQLPGLVNTASSGWQPLKADQLFQAFSLSKRNELRCMLLLPIQRTDAGIAGPEDNVVSLDGAAKINSPPVHIAQYGALKLLMERSMTLQARQHIRNATRLLLDRRNAIFGVLRAVASNRFTNAAELSQLCSFRTLGLSAVFEIAVRRCTTRRLNAALNTKNKHKQATAACEELTNVSVLTANGKATVNLLSYCFFSIYVKMLQHENISLVVHTQELTYCKMLWSYEQRIGACYNRKIQTACASPPHQRARIVTKEPVIFRYVVNDESVRAIIAKSKQLVHLPLISGLASSPKQHTCDTHRVRNTAKWCRNRDATNQICSDGFQKETIRTNLLASRVPLENHSEFENDMHLEPSLGGNLLLRQQRSGVCMNCCRMKGISTLEKFGPSYIGGDALSVVPGKYIPPRLQITRKM
ncbi:hypothetical protein e1116g03.tmp0071 [Eimeria tenella]|uniref:Uncharacterized protein n=1 Tax=Eimeria tenella TaxID=5802 RepID=C8TE40_EIMTE|nr:hypothetical protein e1116g03.tmp0071 [Eimeria tenella]